MIFISFSNLLGRDYDKTCPILYSMKFFHFRNDISTSTYVQLLFSVCIDILMSNGNATLIDSKSKKGPNVGQILF